MKNWIKIYIAIVRSGWGDSVGILSFFYSHTKQWCYPWRIKKNSWETLYVSITWSTHQRKDFFLCCKRNFRLFSNNKDSWILFPSTSLACLCFASFFNNTTHAQILLSLRYSIIPLYLNLATINLHKMVKRKTPLITSSVTHKTNTHSNGTTRFNSLASKTGWKMLSGS